MYVPNINSEKEFLLRFNKFFEELKTKQQKTCAEEFLLKKLINVRNNIFEDIPLPYKKNGYANFLPFFEIKGGLDPFAKKQSDFWQEAIDLMHYFVQHYNIEHHIHTIQSKEEFWTRFLKLYNGVYKKLEKLKVAQKYNPSGITTIFVDQLFTELQKIKKNISMPYQKNSLYAMLYSLDYVGIHEIDKEMEKEAKELLYYFIQNY
jgi:hypothetical protein